MTAHASPDQFWRSRLHIPSYRIRDAASYASLSAQTVASWHKPITSNRRGVLGPKDKGAALSYLQLIELAVAAACKAAGMKLADIRAARAFFAGAYDTEYPFATLRLATDGVDLATKAGADLLIGNRGGQMAWKRIIGDRFNEFDYDDGLATRWHVAGKKSAVVIDPRVRFGSPHVGGVPTWVLKERWQTGEAVQDIADDFDLPPPHVIHGLKFEGVDANLSQRAPWNH